jgi:D-alanyl-lipoteichoic acid acyltransferase DltB (MBOAT superfamily)
MTLAFLFGFQIYFDFAGYSHIALGAARLMGLRLPENFNFPYMAASPREFWRRWHISLSSWVRDYLYLPLCGIQGNADTRGGLSTRGGAERVGRVRALIALWVAWLLMGLWHGANWTFVAWGAWHALLVGGQRLGRMIYPAPVSAAVGWAITLPLVMLGWIFFRADSMGHALGMLSRIVDLSAWLRPAHLPSGLPFWLVLDRDSYYVAAALLAAIAAAWFLRALSRHGIERFPRLHLVAESNFVFVGVPLVYLFLRPVEQFIYFQF